MIGAISQARWDILGVAATAAVLRDAKGPSTQGAPARGYTPSTQFKSGKPTP